MQLVAAKAGEWLISPMINDVGAERMRRGMGACMTTGAEVLLHAEQVRFVIRAMRFMTFVTIHAVMG